MKETFKLDTKFKTGSKEKVTFVEMVQRIKQFIGNSDDCLVEVGSDSQTKNKTKIITAVVVYQPGRGGIFFYHTMWKNHMHRLRDKIYAETALSIECAQLLIEQFLNEEIFCNVSISSDIGLKGRTRELVREIVGYVTAYGFDCKIKDDGAIGSIVADKYSK